MQNNSGRMLMVTFSTPAKAHPTLYLPNPNPNRNPYHFEGWRMMEEAAPIHRVVWWRSKKPSRVFDGSRGLDFSFETVLEAHRISVHLSKHARQEHPK